MRVLSCPSHRAPIDASDDRSMTPALKAAVVLLVTLPVLAYVGGTLSAAPPDRGPRTPVILQSPATHTPSPAPSPPGGPREAGGNDEGKDVGEEEGAAV